MMKYRRTLEFIAGVMIVTLLMCRYCDKNGCTLLIDFLLPYQPFKAILIIALIVLSSRLISGRPKDYSKFFFNLLVIIFGGQAKKHNSNSDIL